MTDDIAAEVTQWQTRPLGVLYPVVLFDALRVEVHQDGVARNTAIHLALGMWPEGQQEVLGLWIEPAAGARFWRELFTHLKDCGLEQMRIVMADEAKGRTGLSRAIRTFYPATTVQTSPAHLIRHSLSEVTARDREPVAAALRPIHTAASAAAAQAALETFAAGPWGTKYASVVKRWRSTWEQLLPLFTLPPEVRRMIASASDAIENLHLRVSRTIGRRGSFPSDQAAIEFVWLAQDKVMRRWSRSAQPA